MPTRSGTQILSRRALLGSFAAAAALKAQRPRAWRPKLGALGNYSEANLEFTRQEGFTSMCLNATPRSSLDAAALSDSQIETVKSAIGKSGLHVSALQATQNHIAPDAGQRRRDNDYFVKVIELAGKLGVPYIGTASGKDANRPFEQQVEDIVRVYTERYFPSCQKYNVKILWEPWPGGPNLATGPVGFEALFKAFGASPYVGLQYDPSHLLWQMMDPVQAARDFIDRIWDVHLKDTEIRWNVLRRAGINPPNRAQWWRYRLPGLGAVDWPGFFTVLMDAGYQGAMNIEHEDPDYGFPNRGADFSDDYKLGFRMAHRYLRQFVPE